MTNDREEIPPVVPSFELEYHGPDGAKVTLRDFALNVVATYDRRLRDELCMLAFCQAVEQMRNAIGMTFASPSPEPELLPFELQVMTHMAKLLGTLSRAARFRAILAVALALAPEVFSDREYGHLMKQAKGA